MISPSSESMNMQLMPQSHHGPDITEQHQVHHQPLLDLPSELVHTIISHLSPLDLASVSATCQSLRDYALFDHHWRALIQQRVPDVAVTSPGPCSSFRRLYIAHERQWFLVQQRLWFCDRELTGKLIIVRFDPRRGCIEGHQLLAVNTCDTSEPWAEGPNVTIHGFEPELTLHLDKSVLRFHLGDDQWDGGFSSRPGFNRFADEMPMALDDRLDAMFSNLLLVRPLESVQADERITQGYPYGHVWPPPAIPATHRVSGTYPGHTVFDLATEDRPYRRAEVSQQAFRIRQWMEMGGSPAVGELRSRGTVHVGEEIITYATLDQRLYCPTKSKPWRGIWVGDYDGHGCEFLLVHQPDDPPALDVDLEILRHSGETDEQWECRRTDTSVYSGRLEGIKLTGDPRIPRGQQEFVAYDIGSAGCIGVATQAPFAGARVVRSRGHVATLGFSTDAFVDSQLLFVDRNLIAHHWMDSDHISLFRRIDINSLTLSK